MNDSRPRPGGGAARRLAPVLALLLTAGCADTPAPRGKVEGASFEPGEIVQSDSNRMATLAMKENLDSLMRIMDKLYLRNPAEWKKTAESREAASAYVRIAITERQPWADLHGAQNVAALSLALQPDFKGDRVAALLRWLDLPDCPLSLVQLGIAVISSSGGLMFVNQVRASKARLSICRQSPLCPASVLNPL